jgi:hypothetical protein
MSICTLASESPKWDGERVSVSARGDGGKRSRDKKRRRAKPDQIWMREEDGATETRGDEFCAATWDGSGCGEKDLKGWLQKGWVDKTLGHEGVE